MRIYELSDDTLLLKMWDRLYADVSSISPLSLLEDFSLDISGHWIRAARAMECRNPGEASGLRSQTNPDGSRSEVIPPDIDGVVFAEQGLEIARPLPWFINKTKTNGLFSGGGDGSAHKHNSSIAYHGMFNNKHLFCYVTTRSIKRTYKYKASRTVMPIINKLLNREMISTNISGILIAEQNRKGNVVQLISIVTHCDGKDSDLPKAFREISVWKKAGHHLSLA